MIFVTVGTHTSGMNRLVIAADDLASTTEERVVIQTGSSTFEPQHAEWFRFERPARIREFINEASIVISHGGAGSLLQALNSNKPVIAFPRRAELDEHVDDHQLELCEQLAVEGFIQVVHLGDHLRDAIRRAVVPPAVASSQDIRLELIGSVEDAVRRLVP